MINVAWYHTLSLLSLYLFFLPSRKKCNMTTSVNLEYKLQRFYWRFKNNSTKTIRLTLLHLYLGYVLDYYSSKYKDYHHYDFPHLNITYLHTCLCLPPPPHDQYNHPDSQFIIIIMLYQNSSVVVFTLHTLDSSAAPESSTISFQLKSS